MSTTQKFQPLPAIRQFMDRFIVFTDEAQADIIALWILHTWTFDAAYATPYLYVNSAEPQSGKTRVLEVAELLARNPQKAANLTTASLFRRMADVRPTLFIDEVDTLFTGSGDNNELIGVLNSGYKQGGFVSRFDGKEVVDFPTFCPKMLVGIDNNQMKDTLRDRCIMINLKRKKTDQQVERFIPRKIEADADALRKQIEEWTAQNTDRVLGAADPKFIDGISDRSFEIAEPLLVLARVAGGAAGEKAARKSLYSLLAGKKPALSHGIQALMAARELFYAADGITRVSSAQLAAHLNVNTKKLGVLLSAYDITPSTLRFATGEKLKGYERTDFTDAWERYL